MSDDEVLDDAAIVLSSPEDHDGADALSPNQSKKRGRAANAGRGPSVLWAFFTRGFTEIGYVPISRVIFKFHR